MQSELERLYPEQVARRRQELAKARATDDLHKAVSWDAASAAALQKVTDTGGV